MGGLLILFAAVVFLPILLEYFETGLVLRFPTLIVCGFVALAGVFSFFSGMILEVMAAKDRRDYEYRLKCVSRDLRQLVRGMELNP